MRIIVDIAHPGHVHFFKNFIWEMQKRGHQIIITAGDKDVTIELLKIYGFDYEFTCKRTSGYKLILEILKRDIQMLMIVRKYKPDVVMGVASTIASHISKVTNVISVVFTDTEHTRLADKITYPFSDFIVTPSCYMKNLGGKQVEYNGYHELAYLHPNYYTPNPVVLSELGLTEDDPFIIIRFVSWKASHDIGQCGIKNKVDFVQEVQKYGRVLITSEGYLGPELENLKVNVSPEKLHDLLYYATLYIGEGGTTASECAMLGTPNILINPLAKLCGVHNDLVNYDIQIYYDSLSEGMHSINKLLTDKNSKYVWRKRRDAMLEERIDVTKFMVDFIEGLEVEK